MRGKGKGDFIRYRSKIEEKVSLGWPIKMIWEHCKEERLIDLTYSAFRKYMNTIIGHYPYKASQATDSSPDAVQPQKEPTATATAQNSPQAVQQEKCKGTPQPNFLGSDKSAEKSTPKHQPGGSTVIVSTFDREEPVRPGNKGLALDAKDLIG